MSVLVIDFGSQVTQLIARRVREAGVYCEIVPYNKADAALEKKPQAIILSGGPASVTEEGSPRAPQSVFQLDVPLTSFKPGFYTCQINVIDDAGGHFLFPRLALLIRMEPKA